jgi:predicted TIM-barrel fold metal-dependent hydrolase
MPVVLEEELNNTIRFINEIAVGVRVIIPHLGFLNGGYHAISQHKLWEQPNVYTDTSLASPYEVTDYIEKYGYERIMFGSDFPFGNPIEELLKIQRLQISAEKKRAILGLNVKHLLTDSNRKN